MGVFLKKAARKALEKSSVTSSYAVIAVCVILVAANIIFFVMFPRLLSPVAIILSNVITMLITALAFRPINNLIQNTLIDRQEELTRKIAEEKAMTDRLAFLEDRNRELESKLDTRLQTESIPGEVNFTFKLEQMEYAKKGYVVKEDDLDTLLSGAQYRETIPDKSFMSSMLETLKLKEPGIRKILYIKKFYYKVSIGIDFTRIKFALVEGNLLFSGVKFTRLHDITSELEHDERDIDHTWILESSEERTTIVQSPDYDKFKQAYSDVRENDTREALEEEVSNLCQQYTRVFRDSIKERFQNVDFVDGIEDSDNTWYALKDAGKNARVLAVASNMLMLTNVINRTQALGQDSGSVLTTTDH